ncbi:MAG TPA: nucleotidyltransferase family protein [Longimicrobiales bacterium]|nr:nucleotidyltransferase family protein [Longimicrobiales bacterium]
MLERVPPVYGLWRRVRLSAPGRRLARLRGERVTAGRLARHAVAAQAADPSFASEGRHLRELLARLGVARGGYAVDLAAGDGVTQSCTLPLFRDLGWSGLAVECDAARFALLSHVYRRFPRVALARRWVTPGNVASLLAESGVPADFTVLNLDLDSFDLPVAAAVLARFRPLVVDMEVNEKVPPPIRFAVDSAEFRWDEGHCYGCSLSAAHDVLTAAGYRLEGLEYNNAFFVRGDAASAAGIAGLGAEEAYRRGYVERADRRTLFPWNRDMEELLVLAPAEAVAVLRRRFARQAGRFLLGLEPVRTASSGGVEERESGGNGDDLPLTASPAPPLGIPAAESPAPSGRWTGSPELPLDALDLTPGEIEARFREARRSGRAAWLWPEVSPAAWRAALADVERATSHVLAGEAGPALLPPRAEAALPALGVAAYTSGMGPLLGHWLEAGRLAADPPAAALLRLHLRHARVRAERVGAALGRVVGVLAAVGADPIVLKGGHTAWTYFPEPAARPLADVDVAVRPARLAAAERALRDAGYRPGPAQRRPYRREWRPPDAPTRLRTLWLSHADDPYGVDLHASLDRNFFGVRAVRFDRVVAAAGLAPGPAGPAAGARVLAQPALAALLAVHAGEGLHQLSLVRLVELVLVLRRDAAAGALSWEALLAVLAEAGGLRFAYPALELAERLAPGTVPPAARERLGADATPAMRRVVARLTPATAQRLDGLSLEERFMWAGTPGERLRRGAHAVWPASAGLSIPRLAGIYGRRAWWLLRRR